MFYAQGQYAALTKLGFSANVARTGLKNFFRGGGSSASTIANQLGTGALTGAAIGAGSGALLADEGEALSGALKGSLGGAVLGAGAGRLLGSGMQGVARKNLLSGAKQGIKDMRAAAGSSASQGRQVEQAIRSQLNPTLKQNLQATKQAPFPITF